MEWSGLSSDWMSWLGPRGLDNHGYELETFLLRLKIWCSIKQLVTGILQHMLNVVSGLLSRVVRKEEPWAYTEYQAGGARTAFLFSRGAI